MKNFRRTYCEHYFLHWCQLDLPTERQNNTMTAFATLKIRPTHYFALPDEYPHYNSYLLFLRLINTQMGRMLMT